MCESVDGDTDDNNEEEYEVDDTRGVGCGGTAHCDTPTLTHIVR